MRTMVTAVHYGEALGLPNSVQILITGKSQFTSQTSITSCYSVYNCVVLNNGLELFDNKAIQEVHNEFDNSLRVDSTGTIYISHLNTELLKKVIEEAI